jgi:uncharacterized membrane protein
LCSNVTQVFGRLAKSILEYLTMLWLKAWHLIAVVSWFAGLFYLPRLFVYHAMAEDAVGRERFVVMERKLYRGIMWPAMVVTLALGLWMLALNWEFYRTARLDARQAHLGGVAGGLSLAMRQIPARSARRTKHAQSCFFSGV